MHVRMRIVKFRERNWLLRGQISLAFPFQYRPQLQRQTDEINFN